MSISPEDIITIASSLTAKGNVVVIAADGTMTVSPAVRAQEVRAERNRRYYEAKKSESSSLKPSESVLNRLKPSESDAVKTPPSPSLPLSPTPPFPHTPTPVLVQVSACAHTREAEADFFAEPKPKPPHKRIRWDEDRGWQGINADDRAKFAAAAPAVDLERQFSSADLWLRSNPTKAKKQNFYRFFVNWISRQQERGGDRGSTPMHKDPPKSFAQQDQERKEAARHGPEVITPKILFRYTPPT